MTKELWLSAPGFEGYEVSNTGKVRSLPKGNHKEAIFLRQCLARGDYYQVRLYKDKKGYTWLVHRLVATAFLKNHKKYQQVNHIDCVKTNNNANNLEWCSPQYNMHHARLNNRIICVSGEDHTVSKLTNNIVKKIRASNLKQKELAKLYNICTSNISKIKTRVTWKHI